MRQDDYTIYVDPLIMRAREIQGGLLLSVHGAGGIIATIKVRLHTGGLLLSYWRGEDTQETTGGAIVLHKGFHHEKMESDDPIPHAE